MFELNKPIFSLRTVCL